MGCLFLLACNFPSREEVTKINLADCHHRPGLHQGVVFGVPSIILKGCCREFGRCSLVFFPNRYGANFDVPGNICQGCCLDRGICYSNFLPNIWDVNCDLLNTICWGRCGYCGMYSSTFLPNLCGGRMHAVLISGVQRNYWYQRVFKGTLCLLCLR